MQGRRAVGPYACLVAAALAGFAHRLSGQEPVKPAASKDSVLFQDFPVVEAASLHSQTLEEAPANITVITAKEIRTYGYRTLGEALSGARGFYSTYDHIYHYEGIRGFSIPGDYNTRFLVMLNGHPLTEHIYNSNGFFGQDFGLDLELVERIEIIRGPCSSLYGSNGMLATINVVTKSPVDHNELEVSTEFDSFGEKKLQVSSSAYLGHGANLLVSASAFDNTGLNLYFPDYNTPATNFGRADGMDGEHGFHTFANLIWRDWSFTAYVNNRDKHAPIGWGETILGDSGNLARDSRNFAAANYRRHVGGTGELQWQLSYDNYSYHERFDYASPGGVIDARANNNNDWIGTELIYQRNVSGFGNVTLGAQADLELRNHLVSYVASPSYRTNVDSSHPDRTSALFAQDEFNLSRSWQVSAGLRFDSSRIFQNALSPRLALVYQQSTQTTYKFVYGRPFRRPSTNEQFYSDGGLAYIASPQLRNETANTFEASVEHRTKGGVKAIVNGFYYGLNDVIESVYVSDALQQYRNEGYHRSSGVEFEVSGTPWGKLQATGSFVVERASGQDGLLANAPQRIGHFRFAVPLVHGKLQLGSDTQYLSSRWTAARASPAGGTDGCHADSVAYQPGIRSSGRCTQSSELGLRRPRVRGGGPNTRRWPFGISEDDVAFTQLTRTPRAGSTACEHRWPDGTARTFLTRAKRPERNSVC